MNSAHEAATLLAFLIAYLLLASCARKHTARIGADPLNHVAVLSLDEVEVFVRGWLSVYRLGVS